MNAPAPRQNLNPAPEAIHIEPEMVRAHMARARQLRAEAFAAFFHRLFRFRKPRPEAPRLRLVCCG
jgi:hypothetical protein